MAGAAAAVTLSVGLTLAGCPAAHDGFPGKDCKQASDCYVGEICDTATMTCAPPPLDLSMPLDFPRPDFSQSPDLTSVDLSEAPDLTQGDL